jgi:hypothetical protein
MNKEKKKKLILTTYTVLSGILVGGMIGYNEASVIVTFGAFFFIGFLMLQDMLENTEKENRKI